MFMGPDLPLTSLGIFLQVIYLLCTSLSLSVNSTMSVKYFTPFEHSTMLTSMINLQIWGLEKQFRRQKGSQGINKNTKARLRGDLI